ncbi:MAG: phosphoribosyltransferase family protein [archaeon]
MREHRDEMQFREDVQKLINMMGDYKPEVIVPLLRGGQAPCVYVAEQLGVMDVRPISVERRGEECGIVFPPKGDIGLVDDKKILLLEDDIPTGKSLIYAKQFYEKLGGQVKIGAVYVLPLTKHIADFYGLVSDPLPNMYFKPTRTGDRIVNR